MADETTENTNGKQPPKIRINGTPPPEGSPPAKPTPPAASKPPPKVQAHALPHKEQTARIDFSSARMPPPGAPMIGKPGDAKKSTSKLDLPPGIKDLTPQQIEELSKTATAPIALPEEEISPMSAEDRQEAVKKSTVRIDDVMMQPLTDEQKEEALKKATVRIDTASGIEPFSEQDKFELAKKTTSRVIIDEERAKGDTTRIEPATAEPSEAAKKRTARIDLGEVLDEEEDIFKRRTALLDSSKFAGATEAPGAPRTIRIKRPATPPTTQMPRPPEPEGDVIFPVSQAEAARKSETARIDLPPEVEQQPPTRKKTIRIKRPGAGGPSGSKPLVITRTQGETGVEPGARPKIVEEDSPAFAWIAIAAVLMAAVLIYVLASQVGTIAELAPARFPYPGTL